MPSKFETEKLVGVQLRAISGDIGIDFRKTLRALYDDTEVGNSCYKWHVVITSYFSDETAQKYIAMIILAYENDINLDEFDEWKQLMKLKMSPEFIKMMDKFTQIPQLAVRDISENRPEHSENVDPWGG